MSSNTCTHKSAVLSTGLELGFGVWGSRKRGEGREGGGEEEGGRAGGGEAEGGEGVLAVETENDSLVHRPFELAAKEISCVGMRLDATLFDPRSSMRNMLTPMLHHDTHIRVERKGGEELGAAQDLDAEGIRV